MSLLIAKLRRQDGQILVMSAAVMAFLFLPLCIFVIDTGLIAASYAQLGETLQASAEDGASMIDESAYRQSDGKQVQLDPVTARTTSLHSIDASGLPGLQAESVTVKGTTVTTSARVRVQLLVLGSATLTETRSATFEYGQ